MSTRQGGFTFIELLVALAITAAVVLATTGVTFQVFGGTDRANDLLAALHQVENAGSWISRDAQMAQSVSADNLTSPDFLIFNWTRWDEDGDPVYHSARYFFDDLDGGIGALKRSYWSSAGASAETTVGVYLYYNPSDNATSSTASYQSPMTVVRLTAIVGESQETREYRLKRRPNV